MTHVDAFRLYAAAALQGLLAGHRGGPEPTDEVRQQQLVRLALTYADYAMRSEDVWTDEWYLKDEQEAKGEQKEEARGGVK